MRMQVMVDSSFARPGLAPIWGGKKGEFRDWTMWTYNWYGCGLDHSSRTLCNFVLKVILINLQLNFSFEMSICRRRTQCAVTSEKRDVRGI